jgi:formiminotetrahydrofolate cyclodeaminase
MTGPNGAVGARTVARYLEELASPAPAPGGGAVAALHAAQAAALVSMVCNLTAGRERFAAAEPTMRRALQAAAALQDQALSLADQDAAAFGAVAAAYRLPKAAGDQAAARAASIQAALRDATEVPLRTAAVAARVVGLCGEILDGANPNLLSDVGVAAASAAAAIDAAALNVQINLAALEDSAFAARAAQELDAHRAAAHSAAATILSRVRERIAP